MVIFEHKPLILKDKYELFLDQGVTNNNSKLDI